jgi:biopolymer transport protein ExbB/TolQ
MDIASDSSLVSGNTFTWIATLLALVTVLVPFVKGLRLCLRAWSATRLIQRSELARTAKADSSGGAAPFSVLMLRILKKSLSSKEHTPDFVFDASRQYVMNEFELNFTRPITMFASLLPPIGFIGTTVGMLILFVSMQQSNSSLELGALAIALTSSIFALIAFAFLEGIKIRLYTRLLDAIREVQVLFDSADAPRGSDAPNTSGSVPHAAGATA